MRHTGQCSGERRHFHARLLHRARGWFTILLAILTLAERSASAQTQHTEHQMQAAVLGNLAKFIDWPAEAQPCHAIRIGILGRDPFGGDIEAVLKEARVKGKPFVVERSPNIRELLDCHIIYFSSAETEKLGEARALIASKPILTVGEHSRFLDLGGMVNFDLEKSRIRFSINLKSVEVAGLLIHAQVLRLATEVKK